MLAVELVSMDSAAEKSLSQHHDSIGATGSPRGSIEQPTAPEVHALDPVSVAIPSLPIDTRFNSNNTCEKVVFWRNFETK